MNHKYIFNKGMISICNEIFSDYMFPCLFKQDYSNLTILCFLTDDSARVEMQSYIASSETVIGYIDKLFISKELGLDW